MPQDIQIQADWLQNDSTQIDYIKHKPNLYEEWWGTQVEYDAIVTKDPDVIYNIITPEQISYFCVEDISGSSNTLSILGHSATAPAIEVFKSTDGTNWSSMGTTSTTAITATIPANGKLYLKATATNWSNNRDDRYNSFSTTGNANIGGYLSSLFVGDNFESDNTTKGRMQCLCQGWTTLISAGDLIMPVDVTDYSFENMFKGCTNLTTAPALPATTMKGACYEDMFNGCASLTTIQPTLPATTLANHCYSGMFQDCSALTTAPALPVATLENFCYINMFNGCTHLTAAPTLNATTLATHCYKNMFSNCKALTTAPALPATTLVDSCYYSMFNGCSSLTTAPATLPATTLVSECYGYMFADCTSLTTAPVLPVTTLNYYSCRRMFRNCTSLTTAPALPATTLVTGCYKEMFRGCTNLNSVTTYATNISASDCLTDWLNNVSATGDFYNLGGATYSSGANGIPSGWTEHTSL